MKTLIDDYFDVLDEHPWIEGNEEHMYLDTEEYVTVGRGHLLQDAEAAKKLPFINGVRPADQATIQKAYNEVKNKNKKRSILFLTQENIDALAKSDIKGKIDLLKKKFLKFDGFPRNIQKGLLEIWFNVRNAWKFHGLVHAIEESDWSQAAFESHRKTKSGASGTYARNTLTAVWFCQAAFAAEKKNEKDISDKWSFCDEFQEAVESQGWATYDDLLTDLSKYQKKMSTDKNQEFIRKLKEIDKSFEAYRMKKNKPLATTAKKG